jgi:hypothetical protein
MALARDTDVECSIFGTLRSTASVKRPQNVVISGETDVFSKKLALLTCIVFVVGLLIGVLSFRNDFSSFKSVSVESDIVQAYFKVYNVSQDSGIGFAKMVSYVVVLNVTNPSDITLRFSSLTMALAQNGTKTGTGVSLNGFLHYQRDFSETIMDNYLYPHTSRLVAFSQTGSMPQIGIDFLDHQHNALFYADLYCAATEGRGGGNVIIFKQLPLNTLSQDEFAYGKTFAPGNYFFFDDDSLSLSFSNGQVR